MNSTPRLMGKNIRYLIDHAIVVRFCTPPGSEHYNLLLLDSFNGYTQINDNHRKNDNIKIM